MLGLLFKLSRPVIISRAIVWTVGILPTALYTFSDCLRREAYFPTTRKFAGRPRRLSCRFSTGLLRSRDAHCSSSHDKCASSEFHRARKTSVRWSRRILQTALRL